jgi:trans-aconitate methyltransferase
MSQSSIYNPDWVAAYYDEYGEQEWERLFRTPVDEISFFVHTHYLQQFVKPGSRVLEVGAGPVQPILAGPSYNKGLDMIVELIPFGQDDAFEFTELGCGTAEPTMRILQHFPYARGTCIDNEPEMLALAERKLGSHKGRARVQQADIIGCDIPACDLVFSAKAIHHVSPADLPPLFTRIVHALKPGGCFILHDGMLVGPQWDANIRGLSRRFHDRHVQNAIAAGQATQEEIDARREFKRKMKAAGKDVEYRHRADDILTAMGEAGFSETGIVWWMFADSIHMGFTSCQILI